MKLEDFQRRLQKRFNIFALYNGAETEKWHKKRGKPQCGLPLFKLLSLFYKF